MLLKCMRAKEFSYDKLMLPDSHSTLCTFSIEPYSQYVGIDAVSMIIVQLRPH